MRVEGATALVTGAAGGIGRRLVEALIARQARRVYATDLAAAASSLPSHPSVVPLELDITDHDAVSRVAAEAQDVNLLVNNAGVNLRAPFIAAPTIDAARREIETNYLGTLAMCRAFAPGLLSHGRAGGSAIVNILSILAKVTLPNLGSYCASKAALLRLSEGVRAELTPHGVHVLAVMPWAVDTPLSGPFPGTKTPVAEVAAGTLDALEQGEEEAYFHEFTAEVNRRLH